MALRWAVPRLPSAATRSLPAAGGVMALPPRRFMASDAAPQQDVVVIGGGPGGYVAAIRAGQLGLKTTCVEKRGALGGTCLNVGCIPSKALLHSSHLYEEAMHTFKTHGIKFSDVQVDLEQMMKKKTSSVNGLTRGVEGLLKMNGVTYAKGVGSLSGKGEVTVKGSDGAEQKIRTKSIILATGSEVMDLSTMKIDEEVFVSSTGALSLKKVPKKMIVIGGGYIGLEMGSVWRRLGAEVTVVEFQERIVPGMDRELGDQFLKLLKAQGMKFMLGTKVLSGERSGSGAKLVVEPAKGGDKQTLDGDIILVAIGRRPYTGALGLDKVGVKTDEKGFIPVEKDTYKTNVEGVYAIGDCCPGPMLAHKAEDEGIALVEQLAGKKGHVNYDAIPGVVYTSPEVATVGKTEEDLQKAGVSYRKGVFPFFANSRAKTNDGNGDFTQGMVKMLAEKSSDKVLGMHIIGPNAGEMIAEGVLAIDLGATTADIARTCHAHPTLSEAFREAAMATTFKSIHYK